jgi:GNAT superfamily N-acetyltransferase
MKKNDTYLNNRTVGFRELFFNDKSILLESGFEFKWILNQALANSVFKKAGIVPNSTGFVAYRIEDNRAIGFLLLTKYSSTIYSIKFVFVAPDHREMGIATGLLNYAVFFAKRNGAKKVYLNVNYVDNCLLDFYTKRGFNPIVNGSMIWGGQSSDKFCDKENKELVQLKFRSEKNRDKILSLYKEYAGPKWTTFFELNHNNIINGFSQEYKRFFSKDAIVFDSANCIALIFKRPFRNTGSVELYFSSDSFISSILSELSGILTSKGISWAKITLFNVNGSRCFDLLERMKFYPFRAHILGCSL